MQDFEKAEGVEVQVGEDGRLWINIDGQCVLRVKHIKTLLVADARDEPYTKTPENKAAAFEWMEKNKSGYEDPFDLAVDCSSCLDIFEFCTVNDDEFSIPVWIQKLAEEVLR